MNDAPTLAAATNARDGERCMQYFRTNIHEDATRFLFHHGTKLPCGPTRAEIHTGLFGGPSAASFGNHGVTDDENAPVANYLAVYQTGQKTARGWQGPWDIDRAAADPVTHVARGSQVSTLRDSDDDAQAFSGGLISWLARANIPIHVSGKWQNGYRGTNANPGVTTGPYAMPGVTSCFIIESDTAHYQTVAHEYEGTNAWDGPGKATVTNTYTYNRVPTKLQWAAGISTVTCASHNLRAGDPVVLTNMPDTTYNGTWTVSGVAGNTFSFLNPTAGTTVTSGFSGAGSKVFTLFETALLSRHLQDFINLQTPGAPFFAYVAPRACHINNDATYNKASDVRYDGTVNANDAFYYNDVAGAVSPVGPTHPPSGTSTLNGYKNAWASRQEMMASVDDLIADIFPLMEAAWPNNWTLIVTGDNGDQIGEQDSHNSGDVKNAIFEGSLRAPLFIWGPRWPAQDVEVLTVHADLPLTILDLFATDGNQLADHHAHTNRDGYSLLRLLDGNDTLSQTRCIPCYGTISSSSSDGYIDEDGVKHTRDTQNRDWYPLVDYEADFHTRTAPEDVIAQARANAIQAARWNPVTDSNPARTV